MQGVVLPETPERFCVQATVITAGSSGGNEELAGITEDGGRVVAVIPLPRAEDRSWEVKALIVYFLPIKPEGDED